MYQSKEPVRLTITLPSEASCIDNLLYQYYRDVHKRTLVNLNYQVIIEDFLLNLMNVENTLEFNNSNLSVTQASLPLEMTLSTLEAKMMHGCPSLKQDIIREVLSLMYRVLYSISMQIQTLIVNGTAPLNYRHYFRLKVVDRLNKYTFLLEEKPIGEETLGLSDYTIEDSWIYNELVEYTNKERVSNNRQW